MRVFTFFLMPYWMNYANLEGLLDKQNIKNSEGIMSYQLLIFHLILVVFSTGCVRGLSSYCDYEKKILKQKTIKQTIKQTITIYKISSINIIKIFLISFY